MENLTFRCANLFAASAVSYDDITAVDVAELARLLETRLSGHRLAPLTLLQRTHRVSGMRVDLAPDGTLETAAIMTSACYFEDRETIQFRQDGTVNVGGWCDSKNAPVVCHAFLAWLSGIEERKELRERGEAG